MFHPYICIQLIAIDRFKENLAVLPVIHAFLTSQPNWGKLLNPIIFNSSEQSHGMERACMLIIAT